MNKSHRRISALIVPVFAFLGIWMFLVLGCSKLISKRSETSNSSQINTLRTDNTPKTAPTVQKPSTKAMAWMLGNNLSLAALMNERGVKQTSDELIAKANILSRELTGDDVPALPAVSGNRAETGAATLAYLLKTALPSVGGKIKDAHGTEHVDLFELAIKSNTLLLLYGPGDSTGKTIAGFIEKVAPRAGLPEKLWKPVTDKVNSAASYDEVKEAVFKMHSDVRDHLDSAR